MADDETKIEEAVDETAAETPEAEAAEASEAAEAPKRSRKAKAEAAADEAPKADVRVRAQARYVRSSARKARLVCDHIRGKSVSDARALLATHPRAVSEHWSKVLESAVANAEHNNGLEADDLRIIAIAADEGPTLKRFRPRAMGRATKIRKRTSHLTIVLGSKES